MTTRERMETLLGLFESRKSERKAERKPLKVKAVKAIKYRSAERWLNNTDEPHSKKKREIRNRYEKSGKTPNATMPETYKLTAGPNTSSKGRFDRALKHLVNRMDHSKMQLRR